MCAGTCVCKYMCVNKHICDEYIWGEVCGQEHKGTQLRRKKTNVGRKSYSKRKTGLIWSQVCNCYVVTLSRQGGRWSKLSDVIPRTC